MRGGVWQEHNRAKNQIAAKCYAGRRARLELKQNFKQTFLDVNESLGQEVALEQC